MLCEWEGNRKSGVALSMHHRFCGVPTYTLKGLLEGDVHSAYGPVRTIISLYDGILTDGTIKIKIEFERHQLCNVVNVNTSLLGSEIELCAAAAAPPPPNACRRRAYAVFVTCSREVLHQLYVARFL